MPFITSTGGILVPDTLEIPKSVTKSQWQDVMYAVRGNQLEVWDVGKKPPFSTNYTIHRALSIIGSNVAQVPMKFHNRSNDDLVPYSDFIYSLFESPNNIDSNFDLWEQTVVHLYNSGEVMWYLNTNDSNRVVSIHVINPMYMKHSVSKVTGYIDSWVFDNKIPLTVDNIIHFKLPSATGLRGMSPLNTLLTELSSDEQAALFNYSYFKNGAKLGGVLYTESDAQITTDELKKVIDLWNTAHQGSNNAYKVAGLLGGMKYQDLNTTSMKDMDFLQSRKDIRDKILVLLGVNPTVMGISENVNLANAQMGIRQFTELTLIPLLIRLQQKLNATLFRMFFPQYYCEFDIQSIQSLKEDFKKQVETAKLLMDIGYTRNEVNEKLSLGMPESDDNIDLVASNLVYRDKIGVINTPKQPSSKSLDIDYIVPEVVSKGVVDNKFKSLIYKKLKTFFYKQRCSVISHLIKDVDFVSPVFINEQSQLLIDSVSKLEVDVDLKTITTLNEIVLKEVLLSILKAKCNVIGDPDGSEQDVTLDNIREIYNSLEKLCYKFSIIASKELV